MTDNWQKVTVLRNHFSFIMTITETKHSAFDSYTFEIGKDPTPCLKLYVIIPNSNDEHIIAASTTANLLNLETLLECSLEDINENYMRKHGFATEILATVDHIVKTHFPHVKYIDLYDASYMPCNRAIDERLDLLTYSVALYGKTWYEIKCKAYPKNPASRNKYKTQMANYISPGFKSKFEADKFLLENITLKPNTYAQIFLQTKYEEIKASFQKANTFPEFFKSLRDMIPQDKKCRFFDRWLKSFIEEYVKIDRTWQYDVYPAQKGARRKTRRRRA